MKISTFSTPAIALLTLALTPALAGGCSSYKKGAGLTDGTLELEEQARFAAARLRRVKPGTGEFFDSAHGYAMFPKVTKGGIGLGAAHGKGVVYEKGQLVGFSDMTQITIGAQVGAQSYTEVIFFQTEFVMNRFKQGNLEFAAQASAVGAEDGVSADADFDNGIAVFTLSRGGLMLEASIGGQKFKYWPR